MSGTSMWAGILIFSLVLTGCQAGGEALSGTEPAAVPETAQAEEAPLPGYVSGSYDDWRERDPVFVSLEGPSISVDGGGATADGGTLTISQAGVYVLEGTLDDGRVLVEAGKDDTVQIVLNGAQITCRDSAPIYAAKAGRTVLTLAEGSENTLTDAADYSYPDSESDEPDAAVFCKDDLLVTGSGSLAVYGNFNNGIGSKDNLVIESGTIAVTAANHGIRGRDSVTILGGDLTIEAGNDGIQSNNDSGEGKGWILLAGGTYMLRAGHDAVQAESTLTVTGGDFDILSGGGSEAAPDPDGSYKGLKAGTDLVIEDGDFRMDCADDTIHADGDVTINGGSFLLASGDDGIHASSALVINGGRIDISTSYEGIEGQTVDINGGEIRLVARDDGVNAAGDDSGEGGGRFGRDMFAANDNNHIHISGGLLVVEASGDGIDSNGNITMSGGTVLVNGPTSGGDGALDFDGNFAITGGVLVAAGSSGMAQAPGSDSSQASLQVYFGQPQAAGTPVHLADAQGNAVLTFTPAKTYQNIVISVPELEDGAAYRIYSGGADSGQAQDGLVLAGDYSGGSLLAEVTLSGTTTRISDSGEAVSGGMGGGMRGGGGRPGEPITGGPGGGQPPDGAEGGRRPGGEPPADRGQREGAGAS